MKIQEKVDFFFGGGGGRDGYGGVSVDVYEEVMKLLCQFKKKKIGEGGSGWM